MCRALIVVVKSMPKDALGQAMGNVLEEKTFEQMRKPGSKHVTSANYFANVDLFGTLLGCLANAR